jgi:hypothetical protein
MSDCACENRPPQRHDAYGRSISGYAVYLSQVENKTRFDPACPFHGDEGTMVAKLAFDEDDRDRS